MLGTTNLPTYFAGLTLIVLLPGPNSLYVLSVAARRGPRVAYRAAAGVVCGDLSLMILSAGGVASLLQASPIAFDIVKFAGAGYLTWLAVGMLRGTRHLWRNRTAARTVAAADPSAEPAERPYRRALVVSLFNPKSVLFFVAFFVQFVDPAYPHPALSFLVLGAWAQLFSITYLSALIFTGSYLASAFRRRRRLAAGLSATAAAVFLAFAAKLSLAGAG
ncbi:leucine efflux protein [Streptomyces sp. DvalAA-14]|uniref:leucine efflux protein LeuE n=1 Tax=unclassified Streptomyces TaxID=2593676 RepID=UPI00081AEC3D|nr:MULTISPECIES: leucine efflux protein LeuE [unclassified Streptomyces]MYS20597.1 leucine efflux protein LeuE [Streptomyces sp. SID4948]SCD72529.1 leucine efflux protein [Streptomyces sp. DvalAA-14]